MDMMTTEKQRTRREHSAELKAQILAECDLPGASVAKVAMSHRVNANLVTDGASSNVSAARRKRRPCRPKWWCLR